MATPTKWVLATMPITFSGSKQLVPSIAEAVAGARVDIEDLAVRVMQDEGIGGMFDQVSDPCIVLAKRLLYPSFPCYGRSDYLRAVALFRGIMHPWEVALIA